MCIYIYFFVYILYIYIFFSTQYRHFLKVFAEVLSEYLPGHGAKDICGLKD